MPRPTVIDDEAILTAARASFLERGFSVTTAEIAKSAGVSEGSIYKRFGSKAELFCSALQIPGQLPWEGLLSEVTHESDPKQVLLDMGHALLRFYREHIGRMLKIHAHLNEILHALPPELPPPIKAVSAMTSFVTEQIAEDRIVSQYPETVARMLLGAIANYAFFELMFNYTPTSPEEYVEQVVESLWNGIAPGGSP
ncbi:MAG: TetR/AcrR family transcriptional regulator [Myxococcota bacterium]|nr:TetR/AcrR family transcriptional regulator [Myxococcota bacterium]